MKTKEKKMKPFAQGSGMLKVNGNVYYSCSCSGIRHFCIHHCKKCFYENIYCHR